MKFKILLAICAICAICGPALAQQQVSGVPLQYIQPFDPSKPLLQQYCSPNQFTAGTNMVEWQPASGDYWSDPLRVKTPRCYIDCAGQLHCTTSCSTAFSSGCGGGGSGTVTSFSAGNLSPLFTTSVATPTTTPALTFSLTNTAAFTLFGRNAAGSGAPGYISMDTLFGSCSGATNAWGWNTTTHAAICNTISGGAPGTPLYSFQQNNPLGTFAGVTPAPTTGKFFEGRINPTDATTTGVETQIGYTVRQGFGPTDTILWSDVSGGVNYAGVDDVGPAVILPTPTALENVAFATQLNNISASAVTVTPAGGWTINGNHTLAILLQQSCFIQVDPLVASNWNAICHDAPGYVNGQPAPGGSATQLQYNTGTGFGGVPGSTVDGVNGLVTLWPTGVGGPTIWVSNTDTDGLYGGNAIYAVARENDTGGNDAAAYTIDVHSFLAGSNVDYDGAIGVQAQTDSSAVTGGNPYEQTDFLAEGPVVSLFLPQIVTGTHIYDQNHGGLAASLVNAAILIDSQTRNANVSAVKTGAGPVDFGDIVSPGILNLADGLAEITQTFIGLAVYTPIGAPGINDVAFSGTYTGSASETFCVVPDDVGGDTFSWGVNPNCSTFVATGVAMTGTPQLLQDGVSVAFPSATGYTENDHWTSLATAALGDGFEFNCANCDLPPFPGAACTATDGGPGARALYMDDTLICYALNTHGEVSSVDVTARDSAVSTGTFLYTTPSTGAGTYRISWNAKLVTPADTSSILGGADGLQITYTDADDAVTVTATHCNAGYNSTDAALNTTQAQISGTCTVNAAASSNIDYGFDYTSVQTTTAMRYTLHVKLEAM